MQWKALLPALVWACIVLILCGIPGTRLPELTFWQWLRPDKIAHLILFGVQSYLLLIGFSKLPATSGWRRQSAVRAVAISIFYGVSIEWMQVYVFIQRSGDVRDAIANAIGALLGWWLFRKFHHKLEARFQRSS